MKKLFCVYCGCENKIDSKKCVKCKEKLNPPYHPFKDYLYDHIKSDLKGKTEDKIISIIKNYILSHLYGTIMTLSLIMIAGISIFNVVTNSYIKKVKTKYNEGYFTIKLVYYAECSEPGLYGEEVYQIKLGDKLGDYNDQYGYPLGDTFLGGYVSLETFNKRLEKYKEGEKTYERCWDLYIDNQEQVEKCLQQYEQEYPSYDELFEPEITKDTVIDRDYILVSQGGCGASSEIGPEELDLVGIWNVDDGYWYYNFKQDHTGEVATSSDGKWKY